MQFVKWASNVLDSVDQQAQQLTASKSNTATPSTSQPTSGTSTPPEIIHSHSTAANANTNRTRNELDNEVVTIQPTIISPVKISSLSTKSRPSGRSRSKLRANNIPPDDDSILYPDGRKSIDITEGNNGSEVKVESISRIGIETDSNSNIANEGAENASQPELPGGVHDATKPLPAYTDQSSRISPDTTSEELKDFSSKEENVVSENLKVEHSRADHVEEDLSKIQAVSETVTENLESPFTASTAIDKNSNTSVGESSANSDKLETKSQELEPEIKIQKTASKPSISLPSFGISSSSSSSPSNKELEEARAEIAALRNVWTETRESLSKVKRLLSTQAEAARRSLAEQENQLMNEFREKEQALEDTIARLKAEIAANAIEFERALQTRSDAQRMSSQETDEVRQRLRAQDDQIVEFTHQIQMLEKKNDELNQMLVDITATHQSTMAHLREEETQRLNQLELEMRAHQSAFSSLQSRDTSQADNIEYVQALANAQRQLEEKSRALEKTLSEKRWLEADFGAIREELNVFKSRLDSERKQHETALNSLRSTINTLNSHNKEVSQSIEEFRAKDAKQLEKISELEKSLSTSLHSQLADRTLEDLKNRVQSLTELVLQKSSIIERVNAERTALQAQLDKQTKRVTSLENELKRQNEITGYADDMDSVDVELGANDDAKLRSRVRPANRIFARQSVSRLLPETSAVGRAVGALDSIGMQIGFILRGRPIIRVFVVMYVLILHLWVAFVLYHFSSHGDTME